MSIVIINGISDVWIIIIIKKKIIMKQAYLILLMALVNLLTISSAKQIPLDKLVQVSPSALDVMIYSFDHVVIYFHDHQQGSSALDTILQKFRNVIEVINASYSSDNVLFGYINTTDDHNNYLSRYNKSKGLYIINTFSSVFIAEQEFNQSNVLYSYELIVHPKMPLMYSEKAIAQASPYKLIFSFSNSSQIEFYNGIYSLIRHYINNITCSLVPVNKNEKDSIALYFEKGLIQNYNYLNLTNRQGVNQLIQRINIDSLQTVTRLNEDNFHRVFGGDINDQILLIYKKQHEQSSQVKTIKETFKHAAQFNRQNQMAYQRVLFCEVDHQFFLQNFNEQPQNIFKGENNQELIYTILFTKSDYAKYQLKRYTFRKDKATNQANAEQIIQFIEDIRMKKLEPQYKSEKVPTQEQNNGILRKIVGQSFIPQVYQKPDQSIIILFIDSKDQQSYSLAKSALQGFSVKYKSQIEGKIVTAIFDLDKNQHKLLYLKEAPQIILFDKSNKKKTVYYRFQQGVTQQLIAQWVKRQVTNVRLSQQTQL